jgi:LacI family transcriptional regulator
MDEIARAGVEAAEITVIRDVDDAEKVRNAVAALLRSESPPTAIFGSHGIATIGAMRALRECGLTNSVALVGFDDFALPELADPWVTVVVQEPARIGRVAAELLFARIDGSREEPQTYTVPATLIARGSGEIRTGA